MTYSEAFPLWVAEVYRNHGYEPDKWYGSEVAETLYNEAMATTAMSLTPKLRLFDMKLHRRETEGR